MSEPETLQGTLSLVRFYRDGFIIGQVDAGESGYESILGNMIAEPIIGQEYQFIGKWNDDPKWGKQFKFESCKTIVPKDVAGIMRYIANNCKWIGYTTARRIVDEYGEAALETLKNQPDLVAETIKGLTPAKARQAAEVLHDKEKTEEITLELESILGGHHIPRRVIDELIRQYGIEAAQVIRTNPYLLINFRGVGFITADRVALGTGYDLEGAPRRAAASIYVLEDAANSQGHVWLPLTEFESRMVKLIGIPSDGIAKNEPGITIKNEMLALRHLAEDENYVAGKIKVLMEKAAPVSVNIEAGDMAEDQIAAIAQADKHGVFILTGAPGTGKTYTLRRIVDSFAAAGLRISLAAPTGKAAKRMSEVIGRDAMTIHRLLGPRPETTVDGETRFSFAFDESNPLPADLIVVDEFSMVDISLAANLLQAVAPGTRLLIVGDHYQLPSVGPGSVLRDLIMARIPHFELTEIKRNTGDIVKTCHAIKDGRHIAPSLTLDPDNGLNFRHIEATDPELIKDIIKDLVCDRLPQGRDYDPLWGIQVMSPMNERTPISCRHLNEMLQGALNPGPIPKGLPFRKGDKVLQRKNEVIGDTFVVNGDIGTIAQIDDKAEYITVNFLDPDRTVKIKRSEHNLTLAYAITIHKMQGSESPVIILPVHNSFGGFFNRELIYTAISRAREICITVGQWGAVEAAARRVSNDRRITRLREIIKP